MRTQRDQEERMYTPLISISNAEIKGGPNYIGVLA